LEIAGWNAGGTKPGSVFSRLPSPKPTDLVPALSEKPKCQGSQEHRPISEGFLSAGGWIVDLA